ncbi:MAG: pyrroline-5-carboxylate reductase [Salinispira sp.]
MESIIIIGFGNMGEALIAGLTEQRRMQNKAALTLGVIEKFPERRRIAVEEYHAVDCSDFSAQSDHPHAVNADIVILAVKPQEIAAAAREHRALLANKPVISLAAGISLKKLSALLPSSHIIRFMPSLAARVGKAVTALVCSENCSAEFRENAREIAWATGIVLEVPEELIPAVIGISGSAIAYVYEFIHALVLGGIREGLKYDISLQAVLNVIEGAAATVREAEAEGLSPADLVTRVCSPGGTTIEGIRTLHEHHFTAGIMQAVSAAAERARNLEKTADSAD